MSNKENNKMKTLEASQRFYYTGDFSNIETFGTITKVINDRFGIRYEVEYDDERFESDTKIGIVENFSFKGSCPRFKTIEDYNSERIEKLSAYGYPKEMIELAK